MLFDFVMMYSYVMMVGYFDEYGSVGIVFLFDLDLIIVGVCNVCVKIDWLLFLKVELYYIEWSFFYMFLDLIYDSYYSVVFIFDKMCNIDCLVVLMLYWIFIDIFEEVGLCVMLFYGGFGLFNY